MEHGLLKYLWIKLLATVPACFLSLSVEHYKIGYGIIILVLLDTFLGVWVSYHFKRTESHFLRGFTEKAGKYGVAMGSVWVISIVDPAHFAWTFAGMGLFIMITEILSNFEKLALLGMALPTKLVAKINKQYQALLEDGNPEEIITNRDKFRV